MIYTFKSYYPNSYISESSQLGKGIVIHYGV